jgi:hypothetical protein
MKTRLSSVERHIDRIKTMIRDLGDLRPGSLSKQYNICGTPGCRCKASPPRKHGPYYQLSYTRKGRSHTRFVRREHVKTVTAQINNYARLRQLVDRWVDLATELSELRLRDGGR